jgi:recombination associated protein RdgC
MKQLFKAATAYRIVDAASLLDLTGLDDHPVEELAPGQVSRHGWINPFDDDAPFAEYSFDGYTVICLAIIQKSIKPAAINREVKKRVNVIEEAEDRTVGRKERNEIKEEVIFDALPNTLSEESRINAYIDWTKNILVIDQSSANKCDTFTAALRDALGSLSVIPMTSASLPDMVMRAWLIDDATPGDLALCGDAIFKNPIDLSQTASVKHVELDGEGVAGLLSDGMVPQEMSLSWALSETSSIDFKATDTVVLKAIKFSDELINIDD